MGLYIKEETQSPQFVLFLQGCVQDFTSGVIDVQFRRIIANHKYNSHDALEGQIWSPIYRLLHRLVTLSINHKHHGDKVPSHNLFYLWSIITPAVFFDLPYMLARLLGRKAISIRPGSPITIGHLFTRLAQSYGILSQKFVRNLTRFKDNDLTVQVLSVMRVVVNMGGGFVITPKDMEEPITQQGDQPCPRGR